MHLDRDIPYRRQERRDSEDSLASLAAEDRILLATNQRSTELGTIAGRALGGGQTPTTTPRLGFDAATDFDASKEMPFVFDNKEVRDRRRRRAQLQQTAQLLLAAVAAGGGSQGAGWSHPAKVGGAAPLLSSPDGITGGSAPGSAVLGSNASGSRASDADGDGATQRAPGAEVVLQLPPDLADADTGADADAARGHGGSSVRTSHSKAEVTAE